MQTYLFFFKCERWVCFTVFDMIGSGPRAENTPAFWTKSPAISQNLSKLVSVHLSSLPFPSTLHMPSPVPPLLAQYQPHVSPGHCMSPRVSAQAVPSTWSALLSHLSLPGSFFTLLQESASSDTFSFPWASCVKEYLTKETEAEASHAIHYEAKCPGCLARQATILNCSTASCDDSVSQVLLQGKGGVGGSLSTRMGKE